MKSTIHVHLIFDTVSNRDATWNYMKTEIEKCSLWTNIRNTNEYIKDIDNKTGEIFISCLVRFNQTPDRDAIIIKFKDKITTMSPHILIGSFIAKHNCPHDESPRINDCDSGYEIIWSK